MHVRCAEVSPNYIKLMKLICLNPIIIWSINHTANISGITSLAVQLVHYPILQDIITRLMEDHYLFFHLSRLFSWKTGHYILLCKDHCNASLCLISGHKEDYQPNVYQFPGYWIGSNHCIILLPIRFLESVTYTQTFISRGSDEQ